MAFETVLQRSIPGQGGRQLREVARDAGVLAGPLGPAAGGRRRGLLPAEPPAVDFSREMVIAAAMETQGCVAKVTIRRHQGRRRLVVDLLEAPPAPNCRCIVSERPLHVVRLPRSEGAVRFEVTRGVTTCGN